MFIKIQNNYINLSLVTRISCYNNCLTIRYVNKTSTDFEMTIDEFEKILKQQAKNVINQITPEEKIIDRFSIMDL